MVQYLCVGTFLCLLIEAKRDKSINEYEILKGLIEVYDNNFPDVSVESLKTDTAKIKKCEVSSTVNFPISKGAQKFNISKDFYGLVDNMQSFIDEFIDEEGMGPWLVRSILEMLDSDDTIENKPIFVQSDSSFTNKGGLIYFNKYNLPVFLISIWHYIVKYRFNKNEKGKETFEKWYKQTGEVHSRRVFVSDIGNSGKFDNITLYKSIISGPKSDKEASGISKSLFGRIIDRPDYAVLNLEIKKYLKKAEEKYGQIINLLYHTEAHPFYDFYVINNLQFKRLLSEPTIIKDVTAETLERELSNFIIFKGIGGIGKSMMMRHLLLDAAKKYEIGKRIPILVELKNYYDKYINNLRGLIFDKIHNLNTSITSNEFEHLLKNGDFLILLDGLDEINSKYGQNFARDFDSFVDRYSSNLFIMSSRPDSFSNYSNFRVVDIMPFTKNQALELIDKLDYAPEYPEIKKGFRQSLDENLYYSHKEFAENPLLLTIMLMTYDQYSDIPSKMHVFYREAYLSIAYKHDWKNKGGYKRKFRTCLDIEDFSDFFSAFCAMSYMDEKFAFTELEIDEYIRKIRNKRDDWNNIKVNDFIFDACSNLFLLYQDGGIYHFIHRSFQEYFCALYFSRQLDNKLPVIVRQFEKKGQLRNNDMTFSMLYDMKKPNIDENIIIPYFKKLFSEEESEEEYFNVISETYGEINYNKGHSMAGAINYPKSFIYAFVANYNHMDADMFDPDIPEDKSFLKNQQRLGDQVDINQDNISYYREHYGNAGSTQEELENLILWQKYTVDLKELYKNKENHPEVYEYFVSEECPLRKEYHNVRRYWAEMKKEERQETEDIFDGLQF